MTKSQRKKEFMHVMDTIYNYMEYKEYFEMKKDLEKECEEKKCTLDNLYHEEYPEEIIW